MRERVIRATDDRDAHWFRSDRFFTCDGLWFFATRESANFGPFARYPDAMQTLRRYLETQHVVSSVRRYAPELEPDDMFDPKSVAALAKDIHNSKQP